MFSKLSNYVIIVLIENYTEDVWPPPEPPDEGSLEPEFIPNDADVLDNLKATNGLLTNHIISVREELPASPEELEETYPPDETANKIFRGEFYDGSKMVSLFDGAVVTEDENGVGFIVPERLITSKVHEGVFGLEVSGKLRYFKEHDDFGHTRFLQRDGQITAAIWAPHLYPFESVDPKTNLPTILDRERCLVNISLRSLSEEQEVPHRCEIAIHTAEGIFAALPDIGTSYGSGQNYYTEFHWFEHDAIAHHVEWPNVESPSVTDFLAELLVIDPDRYSRLTSGQEDLPHVFTYGHTLLDYRTRKPWDNGNKMQAFGEIWVPIDELRRGIDAKIEFPDFQ